MKIIVKAKASAKTNSVELMTQPTLGFDADEEKINIYKVSVKEPPRDGKANEAIRKALAEYFDIAPSRVRLILGVTSKQKVFEIDLV